MNTYFYIMHALVMQQCIETSFKHNIKDSSINNKEK